ncbi:MAG: TraR/DksA family transcriptional regulator [Geminicoccaceae bacterium]
MRSDRENEGLHKSREFLAMPEDGPLTPADIESALQARRAEIQALIEGHEGDSQPVALDQTRVGRLSRMDALQSQAMAQETERRRHQELDRIDQALKRLSEGEYGDCLECGEPIAPKRLAFDPSAALCIDCADKGETH